MKLFSMSRLRKRVVATAVVLAALAFPVASMAATTVKLEGSLGVANVTKGDTKYAHSVTAGYDDVVKLQVYYHNTELPDSGKIAKDLTVKINIPSTPGAVQTVSSKISASNASNTVNSTATVNMSDSAAYLQYIPGSAVWKHNTGTNTSVHYVETKISDAVVTNGAGLRLEDEKPCYNFAATVTVLARVMHPGVSVDKYVRVKGQTEWKTSVNAKLGDTLQYEIAYKNTGNTVQNDVEFRDQMPKGISYVAGSTKLKSGNYPNGLNVTSNALVTDGITVGDYAPGAAGYVMFEAKVDKANELACGQNTLRNIAFVQPTGMNYYYNTADVVVNKTCVNQPVYSCDAFGLVASANRTVTVNKFAYTAQNGATFKNVVIDWGDQSAALTTNHAVGQKHSYAKDGTYTVVATAHFMVNGKEVTSNGPACTQKVSFNAGTPSELPNTGAGDVIGLFAAVTAAGALAHRAMSRRALRS